MVFYQDQVYLSESEACTTKWWTKFETRLKKVCHLFCFTRNNCSKHLKTSFLVIMFFLGCHFHHLLNLIGFVNRKNHMPYMVPAILSILSSSIIFHIDSILWQQLLMNYVTSVEGNWEHNNHIEVLTYIEVFVGMIICLGILI